MRQLACWYDKTVKYEGDVQGAPIEGDLGRNMQWYQVLDDIKQSQNGYASFTSSGDTVIISTFRPGK